MSDQSVPPAAPSPAAEALRQAHIEKAQALTLRVIRFVNQDDEKDPSVILDALLNAYTNAAVHFGRYCEAGQAMLNVGGQIVLQHMESQLAAGIDPTNPPKVH